MAVNNKKVENIMKSFDDVTIEPTLGELYIVAESFGIVDLKTIRELGFEVRSIYKHGDMIKINLSENENDNQ